VIGFFVNTYQVSEDELFVNVTFGVVSGGPVVREVAVELSFSDGTALSELWSIARKPD
jgi:hypothetical protein